MKSCKAFLMENRWAQLEHLKGLKLIEEYGDFCNGHYLHTWDEGYRSLCECPECNALVLVQKSEFHGYDDDYYTDYFAIASRKEAAESYDELEDFECPYCNETVSVTESDVKAGKISCPFCYKTIIFE